jgi:hypothetical protein
MRCVCVRSGRTQTRERYLLFATTAIMVETSYHSPGDIIGTPAPNQVTLHRGPTMPTPPVAACAPAAALRGTRSRVCDGHRSGNRQEGTLAVSRGRTHRGGTLAARGGSTHGETDHHPRRHCQQTTLRCARSSVSAWGVWPPTCYLDFEAMMPPIPLYEGTRPYQTIPFQWSLHTTTGNGTLCHLALRQTFVHHRHSPARGS